MAVSVSKTRTDSFESSLSLNTTIVGSTPRLVIAIDFGTFASGYALQWRSDFDNDRLRIHTNTRWNNGGFCTYKTPTALLLRPDGGVEEFGYKAETRYYELEDEGHNPDDWSFFRNFKMVLYRADGNIDSETFVEGAGGKHMKAINVFGKCIEYMKDHAISHLAENGLPYPEMETKWVLTAGIRGENLSIALEPECAAIYCSQIPANQLEIEGDGGRLRHVAAPESVVMVIDMGGGTVDITTVRINKDGTMDHVQITGGGPWGGTRVDDKFFTLLRDLIGQKVMEEFCTKHPNDEYDLRMDFEARKREVKYKDDPKGMERFRIRLPNSLKDIWERHEGKKIGEILKGEEFTNRSVRFMSGRLSFDPSIMADFFEDSVTDIVNYIGTTLSDPNVEGLIINAMIVVGGFAMSGYVIKGIRKAFEPRGIPVVRPQATELAVLNGAVLFGQNEDIMTSRIMQHTYGIAFTMEFDETKHMEETMYEESGKKWANNVFRKHVARGQSVKLGEWIIDKEYYPVDDTQTSATVYVYASNQADPIHTTESGCRYIGNFDVDFPLPQPGVKTRRAIKVAMRFGGTELEVKGVNEATGKTYKKKLRLA
ncbi:HS12B-like protein [Mya arenaria]|uniref:HS12B-like protein n=1 Tax=Mya arenaria TaxID=6604 RepID=A0ABY7FVQ7_MYAAR|nr:HS12B-like protein [Mya arenaria]